MAQKSALFVCLGNICRSPIAEACMKQVVEEKGLSKAWFVDSAATSTYQIGSPPYDRGQSCMKKQGVYHHVEKHRARQITKSDYENFDFIFGMDKANMRDLKQMAPRQPYKAKLFLLGTYDDDTSFRGIIEDPYYNDDDKDFETVYQQCLRSCRNFLETLALPSST